MEKNMQFAYGVYFDYVLPQTEIPNAIVEQLQLIADTPPCIGGGGVYVARAILGYTELETVNNKNLASNSDEIEGTETSGTIVIYPNPTSDELFILFDGYENGQHVDVELYNMLGTLMLNKQIVSSTEALNISTEKIPGGCYILILKTASNALYKNHLVIIK